MNKVLAIITLGIAVVFSGAPAIAQQQGSNQSTGYALSWGAARGSLGGGAYGNAYARYGRPDRHYGRPHRHHRWR